jgi:hypothetical protein
MNFDRHQDKESIHLGHDDIEADAITRLDLHRDTEEGTLSGTKPAEVGEDHICERCGSELQVLTNLAWCLRCGYTKHFKNGQEEGDAEAREEMDVRRYLGLLHDQAERQKLELQMSNLKRGEGYITLLPIPGLQLVPEWFAVLVCGLLTCSIGSFTVAVNLRTSPDQRMIWCISQASVGAAAIVLSHLLAFLLVVPRKLRFRQPHMLTPLVWLYVYGGLPHTRWAVWLVFWGWALVGGAVFIHFACLNGWI